MSSAQVDDFNERKCLKKTTSPHFLKKMRGGKSRVRELHFITNHSPIFKCNHNSFHDIISCQYGKPVLYIVKPKPGHREETSPLTQREVPLRNTLTMMNVTHVCKGVSVCTKPWNSINNYGNSKTAPHRSLQKPTIKLGETVYSQNFLSLKKRYHTIVLFIENSTPKCLTYYNY